MIKRIILLAVFVSCFASVSRAQNNDPCSNAQLIQSVAVNITSAATTRIILSTDTEKKTYICNVQLTMVGAAAANTLALEYGTGATCGTGTVLRTGTFKTTVAVGSVVVLTFRPNSIQPIPVGNSTCLVTTTADAVNGVVSYALQ